MVATGFSFSGPSAGYVGVTSAAFTVTPNDVYTGTVTPVSVPSEGVFTPAILTWTGNAVPKTFLYSADAEGSKAISLTNSGALTNPAAITYLATNVTSGCVPTCNPCRNPCDYYPFYPAFSTSSSNYSGPSPCAPHFPALTSNFVTPAANTSVIVDFTSTANLYIGQGLEIGTTYYQIIDILSATSVELQHNGLGATVGAAFTAVHPAYGCYQFPVIPAGLVSLEITPTVTGYEADGTTPIASVYVGETTVLSYGYEGPSRIEYIANVEGTFANNPYWIGISLPRAGSPPIHAPSAVYYDDPTWEVLIGRAFSTVILVGKTDGTPFDAGFSTIRVSGVYEVSP